MTSYPTDRLAVCSDGGNLYSAARALNADLDVRTMPDGFSRQSNLIRAQYDTEGIEGEAVSSIRPSGLAA